MPVLLPTTLVRGHISTPVSQRGHWEPLAIVATAPAIDCNVIRIRVLCEASAPSGAEIYTVCTTAGRGIPGEDAMVVTGAGPQEHIGYEVPLACTAEAIILVGPI